MQSRKRIYGEYYEYPEYLSLWRWWLSSIVLYALVKIISAALKAGFLYRILGLVGLVAPAGSLLSYSFSKTPYAFLDAAFVLFVGFYISRRVSPRFDWSLRQRVLVNTLVLLFLSWFIDLGIFGYWTALSLLLQGRA